MASLTFALALCAGVITQLLAQHLRVPGIALLLPVGVLLGPEVLGLIRPSALGSGLPGLIGMAVAVILFEGAMGLNFRALRLQSRPIQLLSVVGPVITTAGAALAARAFLDWDWGQAFLFGTLVIVTGPTVIQPLLRRIRVTPRVQTVLEAESVFVDAVGATVAIVALGMATQPFGRFAEPVLLVLQKLGFGAAAGALTGLLLVWLLRAGRLIPDRMENIVVLSTVLVLYQLSNAAFPESGIAAVIAAGLVVGNVRNPVIGELKNFKEQLTVMLIGLLFVLLAADVRLVDVTGLGWGGVLTVGALMFIVRPMAVSVATWGSELTGRERAFIAWLGPRGIVAAAVASLFAEELSAAGLPGGIELQALVFVTIAMTVALQGLSSGIIARALGLLRASDNGFVILGANALGLGLGRVLRLSGGDVLFMDANARDIGRARAEGFAGILGNALESASMEEADIETRAGCIGATQNEQLNLLFVRKAREHYGSPRGYVAAWAPEGGVTSDMVRNAGATVLFGGPHDLPAWAALLGAGEAIIESWVWEPRDGMASEPLSVLTALQPTESQDALPMALRRDARIAPIDEHWVPRCGDEVFFVVATSGDESVRGRLAQMGWRREKKSVYELKRIH